ncbi:hypothetical protein DUI87_18222 [Hirundo rustica rustica]|uniref:Uncharacterized protein n=1 Tax=Hirundo rustica rustica TaxID=333673 RepID=A0A3M0JY05_HIRRU|nr:hypothetical protein DUI87_18222 [Hirundo rustica rustica]
MSCPGCQRGTAVELGATTLTRLVQRLRAFGAVGGISGTSGACIDEQALPCLLESAGDGLLKFYFGDFMFTSQQVLCSSTQSLIPSQVLNLQKEKDSMLRLDILHTQVLQETTVRFAYYLRKKLRFEPDLLKSCTADNTDTGIGDVGDDGRQKSLLSLSREMTVADVCGFFSKNMRQIEKFKLFALLQKIKILEKAYFSTTFHTMEMSYALDHQ